MATGLAALLSRAKDALQGARQALTSEKLIGVRTVDGNVQVPTVTYKHPVTGHRVILVGMMHVANGDFFAETNAFLDRHANDVVLYEKVDSDTTEEGRSKLTDEQRETINRLEKFKPFQQMMADALDCEHQLDAVPIREGWINTDVKVSASLEEFGKVQLPPDELMDKMAETLEDPAVQGMIRWGANELLSRMDVMMGVMLLVNKVKRNPMMEFILDKRNVVAYDGIKEHTPNGNIVSIWGAAHLPGIGAMLEKDGYVETDRFWRTSFVTRKQTTAELVQLIQDYQRRQTGKK